MIEVNTTWQDSVFTGTLQPISGTVLGDREVALDQGLPWPLLFKSAFKGRLSATYLQCDLGHIIFLSLIFLSVHRGDSVPGLLELLGEEMGQNRSTV